MGKKLFKPVLQVMKQTSTKLVLKAVWDITHFRNRRAGYCQWLSSEVLSEPWHLLHNHPRMIRGDKWNCISQYQSNDRILKLYKSLLIISITLMKIFIAFYNFMNVIGWLQKLIIKLISLSLVLLQDSLTASRYL